MIYVGTAALGCPPGKARRCMSRLRAGWALVHPATFLVETYMSNPEKQVYICRGHMTNHDRFVNVFGNRVGRTFSTAEITKLMFAGSNMKPGSILPNDHADGNVGACWCAKNHSNQPIFEKIGAGLYRVRPAGSQAGVQPPHVVGAAAAI